MGTLSIRLPESLHGQLKGLSQREGVSINQLVTTAVAEKMSALLTEEILAQRAKRGSRAKFEAVLESVSNASPDPWDRWEAPEQFDRRLADQKRQD